MSSTSRRIPLTIRLSNGLYQDFHRKAQETGATHNSVIEILVQAWVSGNCWHSMAESHSFNSSPASGVTVKPDRKSR